MLHYYPQYSDSNLPQHYGINMTRIRTLQMHVLRISMSDRATSSHATWHLIAADAASAETGVRAPRLVPPATAASPSSERSRTGPSPLLERWAVEWRPRTLTPTPRVNSFAAHATGTWRYPLFRGVHLAPSVCKSSRQGQDPEETAEAGGDRALIRKGH